MSYEEILNFNSKHYSAFIDKIHTFSKDKLYLLYIKCSELDPFNIFWSPTYEEETIIIDRFEPEFLYLNKDKNYILDFKYNNINRMIKLSRETLNSEIVIEDKDFTLNSANLYYQIEDNFTGKLKLIVQKENALIEFLFKQDDSEIDVLEFEKRTFTLNKKYNILTIPKSYSSKLIDIELMRNEYLTNFTIYLAYTIPPYNYFSIDLEENIFTMEDIFTFTINEHYKGNFNLMENEYYCVMIENFGKDVTMSIETRDESKDKTGEEDSTGLENWKITLIVIASIIVFIFLALLIYIICRHTCCQ